MIQNNQHTNTVSAYKHISTCIAAAPPAPQWFVLHTRSRQEKVVAADLTARRIRHFLPLQEERHGHRGRNRPITRPIYPGYVFLFGAQEAVYPIDRNRRLVRIIPVVDQARLTWELTNLQQLLERGIRVERHATVDRGVRVEMHAGPLQGIQGVVENVVSPRRLVLQVEMLGQATAVEVDASDLTPIDPSPSKSEAP